MSTQKTKNDNIPSKKEDQSRAIEKIKLEHPQQETEAKPEITREQLSIGKRFLSWRTIVPLAIAIVALVFFTQKANINPQKTWNAIRTANIIFLLAAFIIYYLSFPIRALRWRILLGNAGFAKADGMHLPKFGKLIKIIYISWFANVIVPARLGDLYRAYLLRQDTGLSASRSFGTVLAERLLDLIVLLLLFILAAIISLHENLPPQLLLGLKITLTGVIIGIIGLFVWRLLHKHITALVPARFRNHYNHFQEGTLGSFRRLPTMQQFLRRRLNDAIFFAILMVLLGGFALLLRIDPTRPSSSAHLILQAQAWLHGHLDIGVHIHDSIIVNGKVYSVFGLLPALIMVPFVVILGNTFSDVWFTWVFAALNIILLFRILEVMRVRHITNRTPLENLIIAITFGFGTIALWLSLGGQVWFTVQTISIFGIMITLHSTLSRRWSLATLGVGMVMLTRPSEALIGFVPLIVYLHDLGVGRRIQHHRHFLPQRWPAIRELAIMLAPFVVALLIYLVHNKLYYGNFLRTGYDIQTQQVYPQVKYGLLSWHYIWPNFVVDFLRWPSFSFTDLYDVHPQPHFRMDGIGTCMFFSTPLLAIFLFAPQGKTPQTWLRNTFWVTAAIILLPILTYAFTGWTQVGARYVFPLYPLLFLLLAQRAAPLDTRWISLAGMSILINLLLASAFWKGNVSTVFTAGCVGIVLMVCMITIIMLRKQGQQHEEMAPLAPTMIPTLGSGQKRNAVIK